MWATRRLITSSSEACLSFIAGACGLRTRKLAAALLLLKGGGQSCRWWDLLLVVLDISMKIRVR